jgi:hypothetical protein
MASYISLVLLTNFGPLCGWDVFDFVVTAISAIPEIIDISDLEVLTPKERGKHWVKLGWAHYDK